MAGLEIRQDGDEVFFKVKVVPASSRTAIAGLLQGSLKVKVQAPPERGKANECLLSFLAECVGVRKNNIRIIAGNASAIKEIAVRGVTLEAVTEKLNRA